MVSEGVVTIAILIFLATQNVMALGIMTVFGMIIFVSYDRSFRKRVMEAGRALNLANQKVIRGIQEAFSGLKEIRVLGRNNYFLDKRYISIPFYQTLYHLNIHVFDILQQKATVV